MFKVFWFVVRKSSKIRRKGHFWEIIPFDMHSTASSPPFRILKKLKFFFPKTHLFYQKRPTFWMFWEILLFQLHSTANALQFSQKIVSRSVAWTNLPMWRERNIWKTSGQKNVGNGLFEEKIFAFTFLRSWRKIINHIDQINGQAVPNSWIRLAYRCQIFTILVPKPEEECPCLLCDFICLYIPRNVITWVVELNPKKFPMEATKRAQLPPVFICENFWDHLVA